MIPIILKLSVISIKVKKMAKPTPKPTNGISLYPNIDKYDWLFDAFVISWIAFWFIVFPIWVMVYEGFRKLP